jgi:DNA-binding transcriptional ArsR family regulator
MDDDAGVFRALADPTRRQILQDLQAGGLAAGDIASRFAMGSPSILRRLGVLKNAGRIVERRDAIRNYYTLVEEERLAVCLGQFSLPSALNRSCCASAVSKVNTTPRRSERA